jgi:hypothetical protein
MLDAHPNLAIPPETGFLSLGPQFKEPSENLRLEFFNAITHFPADAPGWHDFHLPEETFWAGLREIEPFTIAAGFRAFYRLYASRFGKTRWGDKTPVYCFAMQAIEEVLPEAHFVHIIRDGRDACLSLRQTWFSPGWDIETQARHWCSFVSAARQQGAQCRCYSEIKYEELILRPEEALKRLCAFLKIGYDGAMLDYHLRARDRLQEHETRLRVDGSVLVSKEKRLEQQHRTTQPLDHNRIFGWKKALSIQEQQQFGAIAGPLLAELGYET